MSNPRAAADDGRSALGRASDARPFRPYVYKGGDIEPAAVIAARERYRVIDAEIERRCALAAERSRADCAGSGISAAIRSVNEMIARLTAAPDLPPAPPVTAASRCGGCGYLTTAAGHKVTCDA